jgi:clan AA aspartic protease (TIGR02281 family)
VEVASSRRNSALLPDRTILLTRQFCDCLGDCVDDFICRMLWNNNWTEEKSKWLVYYRSKHKGCRITIARGENSSAPPTVSTSPARFPNSSSRTGVSLKKVSGTFVVPVEINGAITLDFTIDSGAADVSVPLDVFSTLTRTGTVRDTDIIGEQTYVLAGGSKSQSVTFTTRSLKVGDIVVENVKGGVSPAQGSLLLGQSFLENFKSWSIDNTKHVLLLEPQ